LEELLTVEVRGLADARDRRSGSMIPSAKMTTDRGTVRPDGSGDQQQNEDQFIPPAHDKGTIFREVREYRDKIMSRWEIIYNATIIETWRVVNDKWFVILAVMTWMWGILLIMALVLINVSTDVQDREDIFDPADFFEFYDLIFVFLVLHCGYISAKNITSQKADRSITLYLCRPISKLDYLIIKFLMLIVALTLLIIVPNVILYALVIGVLRLSFLWNLEHLWVLGSLLLYGAMIVSVFSLLSLAIASMTKKTHWAIAGVFSFLFLTSGLSLTMREILESDLPALISPWDNLRQVGAPLFSMGTPFDYPWSYSFVVIVVYVAVSLAILIYNINRVEVLG
jgi:hypothetical protein